MDGGIASGGGIASCLATLRDLIEQAVIAEYPPLAMTNVPAAMQNLRSIEFVLTSTTLKGV